MKNLLIVWLTMALLLTGCSSKNDDAINSDTWKTVVHKEWSNLDVWAGSGLYFYEKEDCCYATFMTYGSGVPVAGSYTSKVKINREGEIHIDVPNSFVNAYITVENDQDLDEVVDVILKVEENAILLGEYAFEIHEGINEHQHIEENGNIKIQVEDVEFEIIEVNDEDGL